MSRFNFLLLLIFLLLSENILAQGATHVWSKAWGYEHDGLNSFEINDLAHDLEGNVYMFGKILGSVDVDPGLDVSESLITEKADPYIIKLNSSGEFLWAKNFEGPGYSTAFAIDIDIYGDILVTGSFYDTIDFDPGELVYEAVPTYSPGPLKSDFYFVKLDSDGNFIFAKSFGNDGFDWANDIETDNFGNIYITGYMSSDSVDFDPGPDEYFVSTRCYVAKYNSLGEFIWCNTPPPTVCYSLSVDNDQNVIVGGYTSATTIDLDPGPAEEIVYGSGETDIYLIKFNEDGDYEWGKLFGGSGSDRNWSVTFDAEGNALILGETSSDTIDLNPNEEEDLAYFGEGIRMFVTKLTPDGSFEWAYHIDSEGTLSGKSIACDNLSNIYVTASFNGDIDFNMSEDAEMYRSTEGTGEMYVLRLNADGQFKYVKSLQSEEWSTGRVIEPFGLDSFYIAGRYNSETTDLDPGMDTLYIADGDYYLQRYDWCPEETSSIALTACDSITWINGVTYDSSTTIPYFIYENADGCDSIVTLNLTITYSTGSTDSIYSCSPYTWIDGVEYIESTNDPVHILMNEVGCDSVIQLNLTVETLNASAEYVEGSLIASPEDMEYQWLDCSDEFSIIIDETGIEYYPTENGEYAVQVSSLECVDTSDCVVVDFSGISKLKGQFFSSVYPNPSNGTITINVQTAQKKPFNIVVYSMLGQEIFRKESIYDKSIFVDNMELEVGSYLLTIESSSGESILKTILSIQ